MIKSELVRRISAQKPQLYEREVERVVNTILDEIATALACGDRVELRGFGVFAVKVRQPHIGRNPGTQTTVSVPEKAIPFFKPGAPMRERLNPMSVGPDFDADPESASYPASLR